MNFSNGVNKLNKLFYIFFLGNRNYQCHFSHFVEFSCIYLNHGAPYFFAKSNCNYCKLQSHLKYVIYITNNEIFLREIFIIFNGYY